MWHDYSNLDVFFVAGKLQGIIFWILRNDEDAIYQTAWAIIPITFKYNGHVLFMTSFVSVVVYSVESQLTCAV